MEETAQSMICIFNCMVFVATMLILIRMYFIWKQLKKISVLKNKWDIKSRDGSPLDIAKNIRKKLSHGEKSYLIQRVRTITGIVIRCGEGSTLQLPTVDDWHEFDSSQENASFSLSLFKILTSSMLIAGIVCTLFLLHHYMEHVFSTEQIRQALEPSLVAIRGTIWLIFLRGVYAVLFERLESRLDRYTLDVLIPCFQMPTTTEQLDSDMAESIWKLNDNIQGMRRIYEENLAPFFNAVTHYKSILSELVSQFYHMGDKILGMINVIEEGVHSGAREVQDMKILASSISEELIDLDMKAKDLTRQNSNFRTKMEQQCKMFEELFKQQDGITILFRQCGNYEPLEPLLNELKTQFKTNKQQACLPSIEENSNDMLHSIKRSSESIRRTYDAVQALCNEIHAVIAQLNGMNGMLFEMKRQFDETKGRQGERSRHICEMVKSIRQLFDQRRNMLESRTSALRTRYDVYHRKLWRFLIRG